MIQMTKREREIDIQLLKLQISHSIFDKSIIWTNGGYITDAYMRHSAWMS